MGGEEKGNMHSNFHVAASSNAFSIREIGPFFALQMQANLTLPVFFLFWKWFVHKECWMASTDIHLLVFNISPFSQWNYHLTLVHDQDTIRSRMFKLKCWGPSWISLLYTLFSVSYWWIYRCLLGFVSGFISKRFVFKCYKLFINEHLF